MMRIKSIVAIIVASVSLTSCSLYNKLVYRIDTPQGNYLQQQQVEQLAIGMSVSQVRYLLGTPLLTEPDNPYTWYYVFLQQKGYEDPIQRNLTVQFDHRGKVKDFSIDDISASKGK